MKGKLGLVGAVAVAWLLTFVLMGGDVLPALSSASTQADALAPLTPGTTYADPTPIGPNGADSPDTDGATPNASDGPGDAAADAEAQALTAPLAGATLVARPKPRRSAPPVLEFSMATFNVLGSSHTRNGGRGRGPGTSRMARATDYVLGHGFSVVGFQEMQGDQRSVFRSRTGGNWALYPDNQLRSMDGENSLGWDTRVWELVEADTTPIPYFGGRPRNIPVVLLRHRATGIAAYFSNFHNPADVYGGAARFRAQAKSLQRQLFARLRTDGYPQFVTGDMNEKQSWFCDVAPAADLRAARGGDVRGGCNIGGGHVIDWILGSYEVEFSNYVEDRSGLVRGITDHPVMYTDVRIDSRDFPRAVIR